MPSLHSVHKSEVQSLHTLIRSVQRVILLLLLGHRIPSSVAHLVTPDVECLYEVEQDDVETTDAEKNLVSAAVKGLVVFAVNVDTDC